MLLFCNRHCTGYLGVTQHQLLISREPKAAQITNATCQSVPMSLDALDPVPWTLFLFPLLFIYLQCHLLNVYLALYGPPLPPAQCWTGCRFNKFNQIQTSVISFLVFDIFHEANEKRTFYEININLMIVILTDIFCQTLGYFRIVVCLLSNRQCL